MTAVNPLDDKVKSSENQPPIPNTTSRVRRYMVVGGFFMLSGVSLAVAGAYRMAAGLDKSWEFLVPGTTGILSGGFLVVRSFVLKLRADRDKVYIMRKMVDEENPPIARDHCSLDSRRAAVVGTPSTSVIPEQVDAPAPEPSLNSIGGEPEGEVTGPRFLMLPNSADPKEKVRLEERGEGAALLSSNEPAAKNPVTRDEVEAPAAASSGVLTAPNSKSRLEERGEGAVLLSSNETAAKNPVTRDEVEVSAAARSEILTAPNSKSRLEERGEGAVLLSSNETAAKNPATHDEVEAPAAARSGVLTAPGSLQAGPSTELRKHVPLEEIHEAPLLFWEKKEGRVKRPTARELQNFDAIRPFPICDVTGSGVLFHFMFEILGFRKNLERTSLNDFFYEHVENTNKGAPTVGVPKDFAVSVSERGFYRTFTSLLKTIFGERVPLIKIEHLENDVSLRILLLTHFKEKGESFYSWFFDEALDDLFITVNRFGEGFLGEAPFQELSNLKSYLLKSMSGPYEFILDIKGEKVKYELQGFINPQFGKINYLSAVIKRFSGWFRCSKEGVEKLDLNIMNSGAQIAFLYHFKRVPS